MEIRGGPHKGAYGRVVSILDAAPATDASGESAQGSAQHSSALSKAQQCTVRLNLTGEMLPAPVPAPALTVLDEHALPRDHPAFDTPQSLLEKKSKAQKAEEEDAKAIKQRQQALAQALQQQKQNGSGGGGGDMQFVITSDESPAASASGSASGGGSSKRRRSRSRSRDRTSSSSSDKSRKSSSSSSSSSKRKGRSPSPPSASSSSSRSSSSSSSSRSSASSSSSSSAGLSWVVPHIRVRVTSKTLGGGQFYAKTGRIEDITTRSTFLLVMDEGKRTVEVCDTASALRCSLLLCCCALLSCPLLLSLPHSAALSSLLVCCVCVCVLCCVLQGVRESQVQTALPRGEGGRVVVVRGARKGHVGRLMQRDKAASTALIKLDEELEFVSVDLDDIAEYVP